MLICFEGVDCAGKTTQVDLLFEKIKTYYPEKKILKKHFPELSVKDKYNSLSNLIFDKRFKRDISQLIPGKYYNLLVFFENFFREIFLEDYESKKDKDVVYKMIDLIKDPESIVIFDRYYYSSMILSEHLWNESAVDESLEERKKFIGLMVYLLELLQLPAPDLNFVIIPQYHNYIERLKAKKEKDAFETIQKKTIDLAYYDYIKAATKNKGIIFGGNKEPNPPVIINDSPFFLTGGLSNYPVNTNFTPEDISKGIFNIVKTEIERIKKNKEIEEAIEETKVSTSIATNASTEQKIPNTEDKRYKVIVPIKK